MDKVTFNDGPVVRTTEKLPVIGFVVSLAHVVTGDNMRYVYRGLVFSTFSTLLYFFAPTLLSRLYLFFTMVGFSWDMYRYYFRPKQFPPLIPVKMNKRLNWMSDFKHVGLNKLLIPGTHDSHAIRGKINKKEITHPTHLLRHLSDTQEFSLFQQLQFGVRAFDLRLCADSSQKIPMLAHGPGMRYQTLDAALDEIETFVTKYPSEVVIITVKVEQRNILSFEKEAELYPRAFERLRDKLIPVEAIDEPIGEITEHRRKNIVLVAFKKNTTDLFTHVNSDLQYWDYRFLLKTWSNTQDPRKLKSSMLSALNTDRETSHRKHLLWINTQLTHQCPIGEGLTLLNPLFGELYSHSRGKGWLSGFVSLEDMAFVSNRITADVLSNGHFADTNINVISQDFVHDDVIQLIIDHNCKKHVPFHGSSKKAFS